MTPSTYQKLKEKIYDLLENEYRDSIGIFSLADVLRAMNNRVGGESYAICTDGYWLYGGCATGGIQERWNLSADLDGQTDECKEFLAKIIL
jgi:hypothetical protein